MRDQSTRRSLYLKDMAQTSGVALAQALPVREWRKYAAEADLGISSVMRSEPFGRSDRDPKRDSGFGGHQTRSGV